MNTCVIGFRAMHHLKTSVKFQAIQKKSHSKIQAILNRSAITDSLLFFGPPAIL